MYCYTDREKQQLAKQCCEVFFCALLTYMIQEATALVGVKILMGQHCFVLTRNMRANMSAKKPSDLLSNFLNFQKYSLGLGDRGVKHLCAPDELLKACLSISHARSVLITTGFPTHFQYEPPEENDGPPGALAMVAMLNALGKNVAIVTDQRALDLNKKIVKEAVEHGKTCFCVLRMIHKCYFSFQFQIFINISIF